MSRSQGVKGKAQGARGTAHVVLEAVLTKMQISKCWVFTDFTIPVIKRIISILKGPGQVTVAESGEAAESFAPSLAVMAVESLLTTLVSDESEWAIAWTKIFKVLAKLDSLPATLKDFQLDVPAKFAYMLSAPLKQGEGGEVGAVGASAVKLEQEQQGEEAQGGPGGRKRKLEALDNAQDAEDDANADAPAPGCVRKLSSKDAQVDLDQKCIGLTTIYCFDSGSDYVQNVNVLDIECLIAGLKTHFITQ